MKKRPQAKDPGPLPQIHHLRGYNRWPAYAAPEESHQSSRKDGLHGAVPAPAEAWPPERFELRAEGHATNGRHQHFGAPAACSKHGGGQRYHGASSSRSRSVPPSTCRRFRCTRMWRSVPTSR